MPQPTSDDLERFTNLVERVKADPEGHVYLPAMFNGSTTFRSYQMFWYYKYGSWPSRLKQACFKDNCVSHYVEQGHVLTKAEVEEIRSHPDYWGVATDLSAKYGVSKARISQIRKNK